MGSDKRTPKSYAWRVRQMLKKQKINMDAVLDGVLEEMERLENIRNCLYTVCESSDVMEVYTNKAGAKNIQVNSAIKEYKMYSQRFNEISKTVDAMVKERIKAKPPAGDLLDELNQREGA